MVDLGLGRGESKDLATRTSGSRDERGGRKGECARKCGMVVAIRERRVGEVVDLEVKARVGCGVPFLNDFASLPTFPRLNRMETNPDTAPYGGPMVMVVEYLETSMSRDLLCKFPDNSAFDFDYSQSSLWSPLIHRKFPSSSSIPISSSRKNLLSCGLSRKLLYNDDKGPSKIRKVTENIKRKLTRAVYQKTKKKRRESLCFSPIPYYRDLEVFLSCKSTVVVIINNLSSDMLLSGKTHILFILKNWQFQDDVTEKDMPEIIGIAD
ncbi:hypothetical protein ACH5RR_003754 [Cinchona calisaya]|uniref:Uncharacterized protein n=1 Tax=Cinchona calisaya TaxID=153742 RepID=A0ABD3AW70_9GENT